MVNTHGFIFTLLAANIIRATSQHQAALSPTSPSTGNILYTLPNAREFLLNVPPTYTADIPLPLVLSFHGAHGMSAHQQAITELSDPTLRIANLPFLTAYGQAVNNTAWHPPMHHVWQGAPYANASVDDVAYVHDMIDAVAADYAVDRKRVYACGKSNGGGFAALLACRSSASDSPSIAAFATVAPALYEGTGAFYGCRPSRPRGVPMLHVHGVEDGVTPFYGRRKGEGGGHGALPDVRVWRREWAERHNGCARGPRRMRHPGEMVAPDRVAEVHPGVWEEVWACEGAEMRALSVEGLGHAWPSTVGWDHAGRPHHKANFNLTSQHLVQFFSRHALD